MFKTIIHTLLVHFLVVAFSFEDLFYVYGQLNQEMIEHGREQYQVNHCKYKLVRLTVIASLLAA